MVVLTKDNFTRVTKQMKNHLNEFGMFSMCTDFVHEDFEIEGRLFRNRSNPMKVIEEWSKTLGPDVDFKDQTRSGMYIFVYVNPKFEISKEPNLLLGVQKLSDGASFERASDVINDLEKKYLSCFYDDIKKQNPSWEAPSLSSYTRLVTKLEVDFKELKKMLAYFPYLKLTCCMVPDPVTKIIKPQNFVQVHYTLRGLK